MRDVTVSLVVLTFRRKSVVQKSLAENLASAGYPIREIIHVDNGSGPTFTDWFREAFSPDIQIVHKENLGVAKGYNRGMLLATSSHVCIIGCDRVMPKDWLATFVRGIHAVSNTGVISCYSVPTTDSEEKIEQKLQSRTVDSACSIGGLVILPAFACEARIHSREFLKLTGLFREDLGLYGYEDVEWCERAARVAREHNLINYIIPSMDYAIHLSDEMDFIMASGEKYDEFKKRENHDGKAEFVKKCWELGSPYYNPYS